MKKIPSYRLRKGLFIIIMGVLLLPLIQTVYPVFKTIPVQGYTKHTNEVPLTVNTWFDESYQKYAEKKLSEEIGFHGFFIRLHHQIDYSCFQKIHANAVFEGKNGYLFDLKHLDAYLGRDYVGNVFIKDKVNKLRYIQEQLAPYHKKIIVVFAPGKASFFPEHLPNGTASPGYNTNIRGYINELKSKGIDFIDLYHYFKNEKKNAHYPLFSKYGIHWSQYGSALASDTIKRYLERMYETTISAGSWSQVIEQSAHDTDIDLLVLLNLMKLPALPKMGYPVLTETPYNERSKLPVLAIADSYFWGIDRFFSQSFKTYHFWSYNREVYPESSFSTITSNQLDLKAQLAQHDVIILLATDANLSNLGWGFIEQVEQSLRNPETLHFLKLHYDRKLAPYKKGMLADKAWLQNIQQKAIEKRITLDSMLTLDAQWVLHHYQ